MRAQLCQSLIDHMLLVLFSHLCLAHFDQLNDPARIEINHETNTATILGQVFYGQAQTARTGWTQRQPVGAMRKKLFGQGIAERFIINAKIVDADPRLRHTSAAPSFERVDRPARISPRHPPAYITTA